MNEQKKEEEGARIIVFSGAFLADRFGRRWILSFASAGGGI